MVSMCSERCPPWLANALRSCVTAWVTTSLVGNVSGQTSASSCSRVTTWPGCRARVSNTARDLGASRSGRFAPGACTSREATSTTHWPTRSRPDGIAMTGGTLIGKNTRRHARTTKSAPRFSRNAKFGKGRRPTVSCIHLVQILRYAPLLPTTGGSVRLSLSPTNSNNDDVPFAPSGAILSAIQLNQPKPLSIGIACNPVVARHLRTALQSVQYKTEFFLSRRYIRSVKRCHVTRQVAR